MTFFSYKLFISCSYIGGDESGGHFSVINEACSMLVTPGEFSVEFLCFFQYYFFDMLPMNIYRNW